MRNIVEEVIDFIDQQREKMLKSLETIVNMDSGSKDKEDVDALGRVLSSWWTEIGFEVEEIKYKDVGNCYIARLNPSKKDKKIILMGHFDTVFPKGEVASRPFKLEGDRAYGPGVGDMKAGLVTMLYAIKALKASRYLEGPISIILNSHEEIGSVYSRGLIVREARGAGIVINLEPARPNGAVVTARKGVAFLDIFVKGKAAHAGVEPEKGVNANVELAHRIIELQGLNGLEEGLTVSVNVISGGHTRNIISDSARAEVDIRFKRERDLEHFSNYLSESLSKPKTPGAKCSMSLQKMFLPMERKKNVLYAYTLVGESADELGIEIKEAFTGGGSDAGFTAAIGIPTICGMGPVAGHVHTVNEYMEVPSMIERCKLLAVTIIKFLEKTHR